MIYVNPSSLAQKYTLNVEDYDHMVHLGLDLLCSNILITKVIT